jgi:hypothetical protein
LLRKRFLLITVLSVLLCVSLVFTVEAASMWSQTYGGTDGDYGRSVVETSDGGYAIAGYTLSYGAGLRDVWLIKTDASGTAQWNQTYGGTDNDLGYSVVKTSDGGYAIAGTTESYGVDYGDVWLIKTDAAGTVQWNQTYGGTDNDLGYSVVKTSDGGYAIAGYTESYDAGNEYFWLVKTDASGTEEWTQTYGGAIAGETFSFGAGGSDVWLVKTDEYGVVPEFQFWVILPLLLIASLFAIILKKKGF